MGYEISGGNRTDVTTVEEIVEVMESRYGRANRIWVMDHEMAREENFQIFDEGRAVLYPGDPKGPIQMVRSRAVENGLAGSSTGAVK